MLFAASQHRRSRSRDAHAEATDHLPRVFSGRVDAEKRLVEARLEDVRVALHAQHVVEVTGPISINDYRVGQRRNSTTLSDSPVAFCADDIRDGVL